MLINKEKFIDEYGHNIDIAIDMIDRLLACFDKYISDDEVSQFHGYGCYSDPQSRVNEMLKEKDIFEYIDVLHSITCRRENEPDEE